MNKTLTHGLSATLAIAGLLGGALSAIAESSSSAIEASAPIEETLMPHPLEQLWQFVSYQAADGTILEVVGDRPATLEFQTGRLSGSTGCNRFFSDYELTGDRLVINSGSTTLIGCPEALAQQEAAILSGLPQITTYIQSANQLILLDEAGTPLFTLKMPVAQFTQTEWMLVAYHNGRGLVTPLADTQITATFNPETGLTGSAGCNTYQATYEQIDNALTIGMAASTRRLCGQPDGVMPQEAAFLTMLPEVAIYALSPDQLDLKNAAGVTIAQFLSAM
ncbi:MAG: META domain-containing protein [Cyanobacteria bacterium P01_D01_bin.115]